jgi:hypothetical protein
VAASAGTLLTALLKITTGALVRFEGVASSLSLV